MSPEKSNNTAADKPIMAPPRIPYTNECILA